MLQIVAYERVFHRKQVISWNSLKTFCVDILLRLILSFFIALEMSKLSELQEAQFN